MVNHAAWQKEEIESWQNGWTCSCHDHFAPVLQALRILHIQKVCVVTPYLDDVNAEILFFLGVNGFQVISMAGKGLRTGSAMEIGDDSTEESYNFALAHWNSEADGMLLPCINWQALAVVERLEQATGSPPHGWKSLIPVSAKSKRRGAMIRLRSCARCRTGDVMEWLDRYGPFSQCLQCGHIPYPPEVSLHPEGQKSAHRYLNGLLRREGKAI